MRKFLLFIAIMVLKITGSLFAQASLEPIGARSAGMGYCSLLNTDVFGLFNNQAALASLQGLHAGAGMKNYFLMEELNRINLGVSKDLWKGSLFAGIEHFGNQLYSEMKAGMGYALRLGDIVDAGIQLDMLRMSIGEGYGSWYTATFEGGIIVRPHRRISMGIHCFNPVHVKWAGTKERIPVKLAAGLCFRPEKTIAMCVEFLKSSTCRSSFSIGCEYSYQEQFYIRAGIRSYPSTLTFGAGFKLKKLCLDIASGVSSYLGISPCISITYSPQK